MLYELITESFLSEHTFLYHTVPLWVCVKSSFYYPLSVLFLSVSLIKGCKGDIISFLCHFPAFTQPYRSLAFCEKYRFYFNIFYKTVFIKGWQDNNIKSLLNTQLQRPLFRLFSHNVIDGVGYSLCRHFRSSTHRYVSDFITYIWESHETMILVVAM